MKTLRKLIKLFRTNKEIQVSATANVKSNIANRSPKTEIPNLQKGQNLYNGYATYNSYLPVYPIYNSYGYPPVYVQGNTMWIPVPVHNQTAVDKQVHNIPSTAPFMIAAY